MHPPEQGSRQQGADALLHQGEGWSTGTIGNLHPCWTCPSTWSGTPPSGHEVGIKILEGLSSQEQGLATVFFLPKVNDSRFDNFLKRSFGGSILEKGNWVGEEISHISEKFSGIPETKILRRVWLMPEHLWHSSPGCCLLHLVSPASQRWRTFEGEEELQREDNQPEIKRRTQG